MDKNSFQNQARDRKFVGYVFDFRVGFVVSICRTLLNKKKHHFKTKANFWILLLGNLTVIIVHTQKNSNTLFSDYIELEIVALALYLRNKTNHLAVPHIDFVFFQSTFTYS